MSGGPYKVISDKNLLVTYQAFGNSQSDEPNQYGLTILGPLMKITPHRVIIK